MKPTVLVAAAVLTSFSSVALAQSTTNTTPPAKTSSTPNLRQQVMTNLQQSGFTDVKIVPDSFLIRAKDKSGNPVTMFIGPNSFDEVTTIGANSQANSNGAQTTGSNPNPDRGGMFATIPAQGELSSRVVGLDVYNNANQNIGTIKDVAFDQNGVRGYVLAVGGFLGMGDRYVAVRPSAVAVRYDSGDNKWHATMNANADQLKAAPEYKYPQ